MKRVIIICSLFFLCAPETYAQTWQTVSFPASFSGCKQLFVHDIYPNHLAAISEKKFIESFDGGITWHERFKLKEEDENIIKFHIAKNHIFIATNVTVYRFDSGYNKELCFALDPKGEDRITAISVDPFNSHHLFIGTNQGLWESVNGGREFQPLRHELANKYISAIHFHPNIPNLVFFATPNSLVRYTPYSSSRLKQYEIPAHHKEHTSARFSFSLSNDNVIYALHTKRLFFSLDQGHHWQQSASPNAISDMVIDSEGTWLFTLCESDVSVVAASSMRILHKTPSLPSKNIHCLAFSDYTKPILFAATEKELFKHDAYTFYPEITPAAAELSPMQLDTIRTRFNGEPSIQALHQQAISYANVSTDKTQKWYRNARLRAFMPTVSFDLDSAREKSIDIDRASTSVEDHYIIGPDETSFSWQIEFQWDFANLLWNDDATTIDYREKYMIETREHILHRVTQLYFERRELIISLYTHPPEDTHQYLTHCLSIDRYTANLDAYTGGWFSKQCQKE